MNQSISTTGLNFAESKSVDQQDVLLEAIRDYWNKHIHDQEITSQPVGSAGFFQELEEYRFDKLRYLLELVDFSRYRGKKVLEIGCGVGTDLVQFGRGGSHVSGVDLSEVAITLAKMNFANHALHADLQVMNGEALEFTAGSFDMVYAHGVLQYTSDPGRMVTEIYRVLRPGGTAILMVYNRHSWLNALSLLMNVRLEHQDAPVLRKLTHDEFVHLLKPFATVTVFPERFPVATRLHHGMKAFLYNQVFVKAFEVLPRWLVRPFGWHLMAFATK